MTLGGPLELGVDHQRDEATTRSWAFAANDGLCPGDEASINIPKVRGLKSFWAGEHVEALGGDAPERAWKLRAPPPHMPQPLFHLAFPKIWPLLYNKLENLSP